MINQKKKPTLEIHAEQGEYDDSKRGRKRLTVILVGSVENCAAESVHRGTTDHVQHDVLETATDVMIDWHYHGVTAYHSATHDVALAETTEQVLEFSISY